MYIQNWHRFLVLMHLSKNHHFMVNTIRVCIHHQNLKPNHLISPLDYLIYLGRHNRHHHRLAQVINVVHLWPLEKVIHLTEKSCVLILLLIILLMVSLIILFCILIHQIVHKKNLIIYLCRHLQEAYLVQQIFLLHLHK